MRGRACPEKTAQNPRIGLSCSDNLRNYEKLSTSGLATLPRGNLQPNICRELPEIQPRLKGIYSEGGVAEYRELSTAYDYSGIARLCLDHARKPNALKTTTGLRWLAGCCLVDRRHDRRRCGLVYHMTVSRHAMHLAVANFIMKTPRLLINID